MEARSGNTSRARFAAIVVVLAPTLFTSRARATEAACIQAADNELALRKAGKLGDALRELAICTDATCSAVVRAECTKRMAEVRAALPTVVVRATDAANNDLVVVRVTVDDAPWTERLDGHPLSIDPGTHRLRFEAAGKATVEKSLVVAESEKNRLVTVVLADATARALPPTPALPTPPAAIPPVEPAASPSAPGGGLRAAGFVIGGIGVAGVAVGSVFGIMTLSKVSTAKSECRPSCAMNTSPDATNDMNTASTFGAVSTAAFIAGGAIFAGGAVMLLLSRPKREATSLTLAPAIGASGAGFRLSGAF